MSFADMQPAGQLVAMMNRIYQGGLTTTSGGNLSILDDQGDIWITPSGIDKGSLTPEDIMQVKPDGTVIGLHKPSVELKFHQDIYRLRPEIRAVLHAHPAALVAFSLIGRGPETRISPDYYRLCGRCAVVGCEVPGSDALKDRLSAAFAQGYNAVMMENHGFVCGAGSLMEAFLQFEAMDFCARTELYARRLGGLRILTDEQLRTDEQSRTESPTTDACPDGEDAARETLCSMARRAYQQRLIPAALGAFSVRTGADSFLITPDEADRGGIQPQEIVRVMNGQAEAGKTPDRAARLHQAIYERHPDVGAVMLTQSPGAMAFACSEAGMDARTLLESYIILRGVGRAAFSATDAQVASLIDRRHSSVIVENRCAVVTGKNLVNAFDRMEVLEYSARALIEAGALGAAARISEDSVQGIDAMFE